MFNSNRITELERKNTDLQKQYDTVYRLLQERQDDVLRLQRELFELSAKPPATVTVTDNSNTIEKLVQIRSDVKDLVNNLIGSLIEDLENSDSDSDEDEDEDDYEDED